MTYTIGDRKISLDTISESDSQLILAHSKLFKYCLNNAVYCLLLKVKKVVHLYSDVMTIYSTLLRKIPDYDDITLMSNKVKLNLMRLEEDLNAIFGDEDSNPSSSSSGRRRRGESILHHDRSHSSSYTSSSSARRHWEDLNYEKTTKKFSLLIIQSSMESFDQISKTLNCIEIFFNNFNNLKKLLIPFLTTQTLAVSRSLSKVHYLLSLTTIVDDIPELDFQILKQLKKIEKITNGLEREAFILETAFRTFDPSLQQYTRILLGKAILKREIEDSECQIIKRREVCFQAAEFVGSIPLTEEQSYNHFNFISYTILLIMAMVSIVIYRLCQIFLGD